jgi:regulatory protein
MPAPESVMREDVDEPRSPKKKSRRGPREPGAAPTRAALHEAALAYLARGAATAESVRKTLERRTSNWARRAVRAGRDAEGVAADAAAAREVIPEIVARLREVGLVNDATFAENRARRMSSAGRSRRAISAHLGQKGVDAATVREAVPHDAGSELAAAVVFARKRRIGPFFSGEQPEGRDARREADRKALGALARAGFDWNVCERVMRMDRESADELLHARRDF